MHTLKTPVLLLSLFLLPGCGQSADGESDADRTYTGQPSQIGNFRGEWKGVVVNARLLRPVTLTLDNNDGSVSGTLVLHDVEGTRTRLGEIDVDIPLVGEFDPALGVVSVSTESGNRLGELAIEVMLADDNALVAMFRLGRRGTRGSREAKGVLAAKRDRDALVHLVETASALRNWRPQAVDGKCPRDLAEWLDNALELKSSGRHVADALQAFEDPVFEEAFDAPYETVGADALKKGSGLIRGACRPEDRRLGQQADQVSFMVADARIYQDYHLLRLETAAAEPWVEDISAALAADVALGSRQLDLLETRWRDFGLARLGYELRSLEPLLAARREVLREQDKRDQKLAMYDNYSERFDLLVTLAGSDGTEGAQEKLDAYLKPAAEIYAAEAIRPDEARFMLAWAHGINSGATCPLSKASHCKNIAEDFEDRAEALADSFESELEQLADTRLDNRDRSLEQLAAQVVFAAEMRSRYGDLLAVGDLEDAWEDVVDERRNLQDRLDETLLEELESRTATTALIAFESEYFAPGDLDERAMRDIDELLRERLATEAPFRDLPAGDYLNAAVNGETARLMALDREYMQGLKPLLGLTAQSLSMIMPQEVRTLRAEVDNLSAVHATLGTFLLEYGTTYPDCLGANPARFEVTRSQSTVTRDRFGSEISRVQNWTTRDEYAVPQRLAATFNQVWRSDFRTADARFMDAMLNDSRLSTLVRSTQRAMSDRACDSPEMMALEQGLIRYYRNVSARVGR